jgi:hypothetical protein
MSGEGSISATKLDLSKKAGLRSKKTTLRYRSRRRMSCDGPERRRRFGRQNETARVSPGVTRLLALARRFDNLIRDREVRISPTYPDRDASVRRPHSVGGSAEREWLDENLVNSITEFRGHRIKTGNKIDAAKT